jgi:dinuclear metal center YbgI/SA1388 family protein
MITVNSIASILFKWAPPEYAASWDNVGIQIGDPSSNVQKVLISLDVDSDCLRKLETTDYDLVITHHPVFFKPIKKILFNSDIGSILDIFFRKKISLLCLHTNLDIVEGGVNDALMGAYGCQEKKGTPISEDGFGKIIEIPAMPLSHFRDLLPATVQGFSKERDISRIAFCAGSGHGLIKDVVENNCDLFITGEINYHDHVFAEMHQLTVLTLGHKESELFALPVIRERILDYFSSLDCDILGLEESSIIHR